MVHLLLLSQLVQQFSYFHLVLYDVFFVSIGELLFFYLELVEQYLGLVRLVLFLVDYVALVGVFVAILVVELKFFLEAQYDLVGLLLLFLHVQHILSLLLVLLEQILEGAAVVALELSELVLEELAVFYLLGLGRLVPRV